MTNTNNQGKFTSLKTPNRNSAIELLRIIAIIGVIVLHYNNWSIGGGFQYVKPGSFNEYYLKFIESVFIPSVNIFIIISAYFLALNQKRKISKVIELFFEVIFFRIILYITDVGLHYREFNVGDFFLNFLPINYYLILYVVLYILSPYINRLINTLTKKQFNRLIIILFSILSIWSFIVDLISVYVGVDGLSSIGISGSQAGYTIVNFVLVYFLGAYIRKYDLHIKKRISSSLFLISTLVIFAISLWSGVSWFYNNPFVILSALFALLFFKELKINSKIINEFAKSCFTCFLIHSYFYKYVYINKFVNRNFFILVGHQIITVLVLFIISYCVYKIYSLTINKIFKLIDKKINKVDLYLFENE